MPTPVSGPTAVLLALVAGFVTRLAFPDPGWWPLAVVGVAIWLVALSGRGLRAGAGLGLLYGLGLFVPLLRWSGVYVGALPWLALATLQALYLAALGVALTPVAPRAGARRLRALAAAAAVGGLWVAQEALRDRTPFGGFPWGRLAFSQAGAPTAHLAALGGAPSVGFAVAAAGALLATAGIELLGLAGGRRPRARRLLAPSGLLAGCLGLVSAGLLVPLPTSGRLVQVAGIQGNVPQAGLDFNAERRAVLDDHAAVTARLAADVRAGRAPRPDLVVWPENASDLDPYRQADARAVIDGAVRAIDVPTLVGAVLLRDDGRLTNASIAWTPDGGPGAAYAKRHPVPFGEYIPHRAFFRRISSQVDLVRRDFAPGHRVGVLALGPARVGVGICFEVAYDDLMRDAVRGGADLLVVQTNNATFGRTDEAVQQLAMSRIRAIEHGRAVAHVSTVGVSALILPDGRVVQRSTLFTPAVVQAELPLRDERTLADRWGAAPEVALSLVGLVGCAALGGRRRARAAAGPDRLVPPRSDGGRA